LTAPSPGSRIDFTERGGRFEPALRQPGMGEGLPVERLADDPAAIVDQLLRASPLVTAGLG
jgi:hypothetical protein